MRESWGKDEKHPIILCTAEMRIFQNKYFYGEGTKGVAHFDNRILPNNLPHSSIVSLQNQTYAPILVLNYLLLLSICPSGIRSKPRRQWRLRTPVASGSGGMASASKALPIRRILEYGKHQCRRLENVRFANARPSGVGYHRRLPQLPKTPKRETHDGPHHVSPFSGWAVCL